jgi:hypothetical protein
VSWRWGNKHLALPEAIPYQNSIPWMIIRSAISEEADKLESAGKVF